MKKKIEKNRIRYRTIAFRMSDNELYELNKRVEISGRQNQDFLIKSVLYRKIVVIGNQLQFEKLKTQLGKILIELKRIEQLEDDTSDLLSPIRTALEMIYKFENE